MYTTPLNQKRVDNALKTLADWFPEDKPMILHHRAELAYHILHNTRPDPNTPLGRMAVMPATINCAVQKTKMEPNLTPCQLSIGSACISAGFFTLGLIGVKARIDATPSVISTLLERLGVSGVNGIAKMFQGFTQAEGIVKQSIAMFNILGSLYRAGGIRIVIELWKEQADWFDWLLMGATILAQLVIWFASDGAVLTAQIGLSLIGAFDLLRACANVIIECFGSHPGPEPHIYPNFMPAGSYRYTLQDEIRVSFTATCRGEYMRSILFIEEFPITSEFADVNGQLVFKTTGALVPPTFTPLGPYFSTANNIEVKLHAYCVDTEGDAQPSTIDITHLSTGATISNINGALRVDTVHTSLQNDWREVYNQNSILYERLLKTEREKITLLEKMAAKK